MGATDFFLELGNDGSSKLWASLDDIRDIRDCFRLTFSFLRFQIPNTGYCSDSVSYLIFYYPLYNFMGRLLCRCRSLFKSCFENRLRNNFHFLTPTLIHSFLRSRRSDRSNENFPITSARLLLDPCMTRRRATFWEASTSSANHHHHHHHNHHHNRREEQENIPRARVMTLSLTPNRLRCVNTSKLQPGCAT